MKSTINLISGLVSCLVIFGFYAYLIVTNYQLTRAQQPAQPAPAPLKLDTTMLQIIQSRNINGPLPIQVQPGDLGNGQLFQAQ
jgi:hypothetical protein